MIYHANSTLDLWTTQKLLMGLGVDYFKWVFRFGQNLEGLHRSDQTHGGIHFWLTFEERFSD